MSTRKVLTQMIGLALTFLLLAGCGSTTTVPTTIPTPVPLPTTEATVPPTAAAKTGTITGRVHLVAPPTPRMVVYAVDQATGVWAFTETQATDAEAPYTLVVPEGSYQVFAFSDLDGYAGYSLDGWTLAIVSVGANQTVSDIIVRPPSQSECGSMFGVPASPDGRFKAVAGPTEECKATQGVPVEGDCMSKDYWSASDECKATQDAYTVSSSPVYKPVSLEVCNILRDDAARTLSVALTLMESAPFTDPLTGKSGQGCILTATGNGTNFSDPSKVLADLVSAFLGWEEQIQYQAGGPTGAATGMTRDMGLILISVVWEPSSDAQCPTDQPISACDLKPEQKLYTIIIQAAQK